MNKVLLLSSLLVSLFLVGITSTEAQTIVPVRLKDVRTVYVDDASFRFLFSSCATRVGKMVLPCPKHAYERERFLVAFKRWLTKSGFTLAETRESAEGIVQGTLSIDERGWSNDPRRDPLGDLRKGKKDDDDCDDEVRTYNEPKWNVDAWLVNQNGRRLWKLGFDYPSISYAGGPAKIEGKKLAKALEYDFKHDR
jgi:hypothetical protein